MSHPKKPKLTLAGAEADKIEIKALTEKVIGLLEDHPAKGARLLEDWIRRPRGQKSEAPLNSPKKKAA